MQKFENHYLGLAKSTSACGPQRTRSCSEWSVENLLPSYFDLSIETDLHIGQKRQILKSEFEFWRDAEKAIVGIFQPVKSIVGTRNHWLI